MFQLNQWFIAGHTDGLKFQLSIRLGREEGQWLWVETVVRVGCADKCRKCQCTSISTFLHLQESQKPVWAQSSFKRHHLSWVAGLPLGLLLVGRARNTSLPQGASLHLAAVHMGEQQRFGVSPPQQRREGLLWTELILLLASTGWFFGEPTKWLLDWRLTGN